MPIEMTEIGRKATTSGPMKIETVTFATPHQFRGRAIELVFTTSRLAGRTRTSWSVHLRGASSSVAPFASPEAALAFYGVAAAA